MRSVSTKESYQGFHSMIKGAFPNSGTARYDMRACICIFGFYICFFLLCFNIIPIWFFLCMGPVFFIRYFVAYHMHFHADRRVGRFSEVCTYIPVIVGPLQLGYREYRSNHFKHHANDGRLGDPDLFITGQKTLVGGIFHSFFEPEQALIRYIAAEGLTLRLFIQSLFYFFIFVSFALWGGVNFWYYLAVTRAGSFFSWFVFAWYLHRPHRYFVCRQNTMPRWLAPIYGILFGRDCLIGTLGHFTHHRFSFLPDERLAEVARFLEARST